jgi:hypothetical protein
VRVSVAAMKMATTAAINMVASLVETIPSWIPFCHKSSISRLCAKDQEDGPLNRRLATHEKRERSQALLVIALVVISLVEGGRIY